MGIHCSSELHRGQIKSTINMQAFLILPSILVLSVLTVNEVHGWYGGYYGYPYFHAAAYVPLTVEPRNPTAYGYSAGAKVVVAEPKVVKRNAEADPEADPQLFLPPYYPHVYAHPAYVPVLPKTVAGEKLTPDAYGY